MKDKRINIGLFVSDLSNEFDNAVCKGVMQGAKEVDANLIIFPGRYLKAQYHDKEYNRCEYQYNTLFSYANENNIDVLLILLGTIGTVISDAEKKVFLDTYQNIPVLLLAEERKGFSSVSFDNRIGFRDGISSIIQKGCKKIGFVSGPVTNEDAKERLEVYKQVLTANDIPYDEDKVVYGNFSEYSDDIVNNLLDKNPDLDAVVFANDQMAIGGYRVFENRGIKVGEDVLVMGFDDSASAQSLVPSLTTIRADAVELGRTGAIEAANFLATRMERKKYVKTSLVQRDSTGKNDFDLISLLEKRDFGKFFQRNVGMAATILIDTLMVDKRKDKDLMYFSSICSDLVREMFTQIRSDDEEMHKGQYLYHLIDKVMNSKIGETIDTTTIFRLLNSIILIINKYMPEKSLLAQQLIYDYLSHVTTIIYNRKKFYEKDMDNLIWMCNGISKDMLIYDMEDDRSYGTVISKAIKLGFQSAYLYAFKVPYINYDSNAWHDWQVPKTMLLKSYFTDSDQSVVVDPKNQEIESGNIFTNSFMPQNRRFTILVSNIFINEEQLGMFLVEIEHDQLHLLSPFMAQLNTGFKIIYMQRTQACIEEQLERSLTKIKETSVMVETLSKADELTGIYNRRGFFELSNKHIRDKRNAGKHAVLIYAGIDNLKDILEEEDKASEDEIIKKVALLIKDAMRTSDVVARVGFDMFAVVAITDEPVKGDCLTSRINKLLKECNSKNKNGVDIKLSMGYSRFTCASDEMVENHLEEADAMLLDNRKSK